MKSYAIVLSLLLTTGAFAGQSGKDTVDTHVAAAKAAARQEHTSLLNLCSAPEPAPAAQQGQRAAAQPPGPPDRSKWHAEPVKVFDNLYFVGMTEYSSWAVNTSDGIIVIDAIFDYSVEDEIAKGLPKLGLDPKKIKYVIVSHGHIDHAGGAKYLQDHFGAHVIMGGPDWDLLDRDRGAWPKPKRDMVATDGQRLTLGDTTLTLYLTPGHTLGTISTLIPVKDGGKPHLAALWGGTGFNWLRNRTTYITRIGRTGSGSRPMRSPRAVSVKSSQRRVPTSYCPTIPIPTDQRKSYPRWRIEKPVIRILTLSAMKACNVFLRSPTNAPKRASRASTEIIVSEATSCGSSRRQ